MASAVAVAGVAISTLATVPLDAGQEVVLSEVDAEGEIYLDVRERNTATGEWSEGLMLRAEDWDRVLAVAKATL